VTLTIYRVRTIELSDNHRVVWRRKMTASIKGRVLSVIMAVAGALGLAVVASTIAVVSRISSVRRGWIDEVWRFGMDGIDERPDDEQRR